MGVQFENSSDRDAIQFLEKNRIHKQPPQREVDNMPDNVDSDSESSAGAELREAMAARNANVSQVSEAPATPADAEEVKTALPESPPPATAAPPADAGLDDFDQELLDDLDNLDIDDLDDLDVDDLDVDDLDVDDLDDLDVEEPDEGPDEY